MTYSLLIVVFSLIKFHLAHTHIFSKGLKASLCIFQEFFFIVSTLWYSILQIQAASVSPNSYLYLLNYPCAMTQKVISCKKPEISYSTPHLFPSLRVHSSLLSISNIWNQSLCIWSNFLVVYSGMAGLIQVTPSWLT